MNADKFVVPFALFVWKIPVFLWYQSSKRYHKKTGIFHYISISQSATPLPLGKIYMK
jgi:hypothetical protein